MTLLAETLEADETYIAEGLTYAEFQQEFAGQHAEWVAGKVLLLVNNWQHPQILFFLSALLKSYLAYRPVGQVVIAGFQMKWSPDSNGREPDVMLVLNEHVDRIGENQLKGVADMVVEIVSPESRFRDHVTKYEEYEAAGVPEYWLIDPLRKQADIYHLNEAGYYVRLPLNAEGRLVSPLLPDFALDPALLWSNPLPDPVQIVALVQGMLA